MGVGTSSAAALIPTAVETQIPAVADFVQKGGVTNTVPSPLNPAVVDDLWLAEHRPMPNQPTSAALHDELRLLRTKAGVVPKRFQLAGSSASAGGIAMAAVATFAVGWQIGTGIRKQFLETEIPGYTAGPFAGGGPWTLASWTLYEQPSPYAPRLQAKNEGDCTDENCNGVPAPYLRMPFDGLLVKSHGRGFNGNPFGPYTIFTAPGTADGNYYSPPATLFTGTYVAQSAQAYGVSVAIKPKTPKASTDTAESPVALESATPSDVSRSLAESRILTELQNHPEDYPTLLPWLDSQMGGSSQDPTQVYATMPNCVGMTVAACQSAVSAAGYTGTVTVNTLSINAAVLTKPAGSVVTTTPASGAQSVATTTVTINANPDPLPVEVMAPAAHETYDAYVARLRAAGLTGTITRVDLDGTTLDPQRGPNEVVSTSPGTGTRVGTTTEVKVRTNPDTAPEGGTGTEAPFAFNIPSINLGPLSGAVSGCKFPFCVFSWIDSIFDGWVGSSSCPQWDIPLAGQELTIDFCVANPMMDIVRPAILIVSGLLMAWTFASAAMGIGRGND